MDESLGNKWTSQNIPVTERHYKGKDTVAEIEERIRVGVFFRKDGLGKPF